MTGPDFIKEISQNDLDAKSLKVDSKQLDQLLEIKFKAYLAEDKKLADKHGVGTKVDLADQKKREDLQKDFNEYIDAEWNKVEKSEIDKAMKEFQLELNSLQTQIEIGALQDEVIAGNTDAGKESDTKTIENKITGKFKLYNAIKISDISNEIVGLSTDKQTQLTDLLSTGKIKDFQKIIAPDKEDAYLRDGKFGSKTLAALQDYVKNNKNTPQDKPSGAATGSGGTADKPGDKSSDKPAGSATDNSGGTADKPGDKPTDKPADSKETPKLTEVTDKVELEKITKKQFDIAEFKRGKIQKNSTGEYFAQVKATIDGTEYDFTKTDLLKFDKDGNLAEGQTIKTTNKEREPLYFVDENKIKFLERYSEGMYLTKDTITGVTPTPEPENIDYDYDPSEFELTEGKRVEYQFQSLGYASLDKHPALKDIMDRIINPEDGKEKVSKRMYKINLSPNDGLAKIILDIYGKDSTNEKAKKLRNIKGSIGKGDIKDCFPYYKRAGGLDSETKKIAIILNQAKERDLKNFAEDARSYGEDYKDKFEKAEKFDQVIDTLSDTNILQALCDYNVDGQISAIQGKTQLKAQFFASRGKAYPGGEYDGWKEDFKKYREERKAKNKEFKKNQEGIGDTGTIFGPQLYHELQRAIAVMDVKLKYEPDTMTEYLKKYNLDKTAPKPVLTGENIVIANIVRNIAWISSNKILEQAIEKVPANQRNGSKLLEMAKNYTGKEGFENNGNFQPLFSKAIEEINGSSSSISPDLFDNLVGVERLSTDTGRYAMIEKELDAYLAKHPEMATKFKSDGFTDAKHTFITGLMSVLDNLQITASPTLLSVDKSRDTKKFRHKLENEFTKNLIGGGLTANTDGTIGLRANLGKINFSDSGKFQWGRNTGAGVNYNPVTQILSVSVRVGAEAAWEYNYDKVVSGRLDDIKSAKYIGIGGGANATGTEVAGQIVAGGVAGVEIDWKQNPKQAIEQMNRQYRDISNGIFHLPSGADIQNLKNSAGLEAYLLTRLNRLKTSAKEPIKTFINTNEGFFKGNIKNVADYFDKKGIFEMINNMPNEFAGDKKKNAINNLLQVLQSGIVDSWRDYMYDQLHGKVSVTKIGAGVGIGYAVVDGIGFGIPFPMISFDISTWRKNYVSSEAGKYMDQKIIRDGEVQGHSDEFEPKGNDLNVYAEYIKARYNNLPGLEVTVNEGKFDFTYSDPNGGDKKIGDVLDIRCKLDQKVLDNVKYSDDGTTLTIGNVGNLGMFSSADGQGVRNFLIIGQKGTVDKNNKANTCILKPPHPSPDYQGTIKDIQPIKIEKSGYKNWTMEDIKKFLDNNFSAPEGANYTTKIEDVKKEILGQVREISGNLFINGLNGKSGLSKFPTTGTVEFKKDTTGKITISSGDSPKDKLEIKYTYNAKGSVENTLIGGDVLYHSFENIFSRPDLDMLFTDLEGLSKLDNGKIKKLGEFLERASNDIDNDRDIDSQEYEKSSSVLKELLGKNYPSIAKILEGSDIDSKVLIVNRMKGIFATEKGVTKYKTLKAIVDTRNQVYKEKLFGPSGEKLPNFSMDYRNAVLEKLSTQDNLSQNIESGLFGYTAFYRRGTGEGRRYSLTAPGASKVLGGEKIPFEGNDEKLARDWFIKNFEKDKASLTLITKSINAQIPKSIGIVGMISESNTIDLLSGKSLDIGGRIFTLNSTMSFYLLGECANESLGIKLNGLGISSKDKPNPEPKPGESEVYTGEIVPQDNYVGGIDVSSRNLSVAMVPGAYQHDIGINLLKNDISKPPPPPPTIPDPINPPPSPNPTIIDPVVPGPTVIDP